MTAAEGNPLTAISIAGSTIPLGAFLKHAQAVQTGGDAKVLIQQGRVRLNGIVETRRRHALVDGDVVELPGGIRLQVVVATGLHP